MGWRVIKPLNGSVGQGILEGLKGFEGVEISERFTMLRELRDLERFEY